MENEADEGHVQNEEKHVFGRDTLTSRDPGHESSGTIRTLWATTSAKIVGDGRPSVLNTRSIIEP